MTPQPHLDTQCVHAGGLPDTASGGINSPIYTSTAAGYLDRDRVPYQRYFNTPNQAAVVQKVCGLEGAEDGVLFGSGMAAISTVLLTLLRAGDHAVLQEELYGGTHAFVAELFERLGIGFDFVALTPAACARALTPKTKALFLESPTNPLLHVMDLRGVAEVARARGVTTVIDNTFATPILQQPIALGIDVVIHSGTKYLGGHSDLQCGIAVAHAALAAQIRHQACHLGGSLNAPSCYLLERSLKTLHLRVERQTANALCIAQFLAEHPAVARVYYPGLTTHPGHDLARAQMRGFGAMLAFDLRPGRTSADTVQRRLRLIRPAASLGGVETTICAPARTSHVKLSGSDRERLGISEALLRLSVGIEHHADLTADLAEALD
ncbi:MAG: PLP-dependent transferase [Verrucomicrobia bacterium]|nr:PLP-dependent transferase [Verrucomicrobiota bacterium]